jgi:hypothetical protein
MSKQKTSIRIKEDCMRQKLLIGVALAMIILTVLMVTLPIGNVIAKEEEGRMRCGICVVYIEGQTYTYLYYDPSSGMGGYCPYSC